MISFIGCDYIEEPFIENNGGPGPIDEGVTKVLLEEFTDIPKKNTIIAMLLLLFFVYIIYKIFSNKSVQQGIGLGVGMNIGDNIGDGLVYAGTKAYENSDAISNVGSNILSAAISAGKDIL